MLGSLMRPALAASGFGAPPAGADAAHALLPLLLLACLLMRWLGQRRVAPLGCSDVRARLPAAACQTGLLAVGAEPALGEWRPAVQGSLPLEDAAPPTPPLALEQIGAVLDAHEGPAVLLGLRAEGEPRIIASNAGALALKSGLGLADGDGGPRDLWRCRGAAAALDAAWHDALDEFRLRSGAAEARMVVVTRRACGSTLVLRALPRLQADGWRFAVLGIDEASCVEEAAALDDQEAFVYAVSHDLRAPLRVVDGFARILKEDYGRLLDRLGSDYLERILGAAARMNGMIDAVLDQARLSMRPLAREAVDLSLLAQQMLDELRRQAPDRDVEVLIEDGMVAQGDPALLRSVVENLLGNAWKYSARRGHARIEFLRVPSDGHPDARVYCVRDNGVGFDMRYADRLFGMFQRMHSANDYQGTGVGLASVRRIVLRHGGQIWAESEVDGGARFFFTLG